LRGVLIEAFMNEDDERYQQALAKLKKFIESRRAP